MRIALVSDCYWPRVNGVTVSVQTYKDELTDLGHEVLVLCPEYPASYGPSAPERGIRRLRSMSNGVSREDRLVRPTAFPALFRALTRFKPDVIHINTEFTAGILARAYARLRGYPLLLTSHTDYEDYICNYIRWAPQEPLRALARFFMRAIFRNAQVVIAPSKAQAQKLRGYHINRKIVIIPSGISRIFAPRRAAEAAACRAELEARFPALAGRRVLLFAGRVTVEKNVKFLLPVLKEVVAAGQDAALLVAGDGPVRAQLEASAARAGLAGRSAFAGFVPPAELARIYAAADVFVFPSRTETLGLCTIEAMATGLPVVAIGEMGTRDVMRGDHGGFMVEADRAAFSKAVLALLADPALRAAKSAEAVAWARQYGLGESTRRLARLYRVVADRRARILALRSGIR